MNNAYARLVMPLALAALLTPAIVAAHDRFDSSIESQQQDSVQLDELLLRCERLMMEDPSKLDSLSGIAYTRAFVISDSVHMAEARMFKAVAHAMRDELGPALRIFHEVQLFAMRRELTSMQINALNNMAGVYRYAGNFEKAAEKLDEALALIEDEKSVQRGHLLLGLGKCHDVNGEPEKALVALREALDIFDDIQDAEMAAQCLSEIGTVYELQGRYAEATRHYNRLLNLLSHAKLPTEQVSAHQRLGILNLRQNQPLQALVSLQRALFMSDSLQYYNAYDTTLKYLVEATTLLGMSNMCVEYNRMRDRYSVAGQRRDSALANMEFEYMIRQKALENELLRSVKENLLIKVEKTEQGMYAFALMLLIMGIALYFMHANYKKQKLLKEKNRQVNQLMELTINDRLDELVARNMLLRMHTIKVFERIVPGNPRQLPIRKHLDKEGRFAHADPQAYSELMAAIEAVEKDIRELLGHLNSEHMVIEEKFYRPRVKVIDRKVRQLVESAKAAKSAQA